MEIFTDFVQNYKGSLQGLNIFAKIGVTLALVLILIAVVAAIVNVIVHTI